MSTPSMTRIKSGHQLPEVMPAIKQVAMWSRLSRRIPRTFEAEITTGDPANSG
ncbi:MAG: hypothetical protein JO061_18885 [Acidobacteriaceae bacterium]|nr:hypothetical protein [Acidobacteriaceae bacterium]